MSKSQLVICFDRLTRFKFTEDKYLRVFKEIILSNLIEPKFKKSKLDTMDYECIRDYAQEIINFSLNALEHKTTKNYSINKKILEYEKSVFTLDKKVSALLENKIDYNSALKILDKKKLPQNLIWLASLDKNTKTKSSGKKLNLKFPVKKLVLVEGITEEILLPKLAKISGLDFDKNGIYLISAGGKNQVVKLFYQYAQILKIPIFVLLDNDASENLKEIQPKLRKSDSIHLLKKGEFEDILPHNLIKRTLNKIFDYNLITISELRQNLPMTKLLEEIFKIRGKEFKKAEFALLLSQNLKNKKDISSEMELIIEQILKTI